jgi:hypothetical protein
MTTKTKTGTTTRIISSEEQRIGFTIEVLVRFDRIHQTPNGLIAMLRPGEKLIEITVKEGTPA